MFSHLTVNCSLLRFIKGQLDFFSSITACLWLEWWLLLFFCAASGSIHFKAYVHLEKYLSFLLQESVCFLVWGQLSGNQWRLHEQLFLQTVSLFFFFLRLCVCRFLCEAAATAAQLPQNFRFSLCGHMNGIHPTIALTASVPKCFICT